MSTLVCTIIGALIGVFFFGVGAIPGAIIGFIVGRIKNKKRKSN